MAKAAKKAAAKKSVEALKHDEAKRKNIPTAEYQSVLEKELREQKKVRYPRNTDLDPQLVWRGKDEQDWSDLVAYAPPLYIQEKVHPKVLIDDLLRVTKKKGHDKGEPTPDLFADFNGIPKGVDKTEFYQHDQNWSNRIILGDSLQVMASLAEREGLRGKVQCIYFDPPYGIKFNSNFQWSTTSRDVKDGNAGHITREPEQVKAFRDTWRDGIHSYLTYLRDRLTVARDLLSESGSIFIQIGDENVHRVRALMDEVFGERNCISEIIFQKTGGQTSEYLSSIQDYVLWYAKDTDQLKYRQPLQKKELGVGHGSGARYDQVDEDGNAFQLTSLTSNRPPGDFPVELHGISYGPSGGYWKTGEDGFRLLIRADRIRLAGRTLRYVRYIADFPAYEVTNIWTDTAGSAGKIYVVQTSTAVVQRCILMATDPSDLVLDPTCGSGTTAFVAEQWGRRWITIDTSRVALALARARIMGARFPFYLLADSHDGQIKEAEVARTAPSSKPAHGNIRHGFVYERVPHITLKSIANNAEIDVIWDHWRAKLEPLRDKLNAALIKQWQDWEIPREADKGWSGPAQKMHTEWWQARIARQKEIDASIAAKAEFEYLYDRPYDDKRRVRVAGPFTIESLSPHRVLGVDENDELIDGLKEDGAEYEAKKSFPEMILENLKIAGVQQAHKQDRITFTALTPWPGDLDDRFQEIGTHGTGGLVADSSFADSGTRSGAMAGWRQAIDLAMTDEEIASLRTISRSRTELARRVERAQMLLAYRENPSFFAVGRSLGVHHQKVERCVERALADGPLAALDDRPHPGREPTITPEAKAWLVSLACDKAKDHGYPHELWTTRLLARHAREHGPAMGHDCLSKLAQGTVCKILGHEEIKPHKVRYYLERRDVEFEQKMADVLCIYREVQILKKTAAKSNKPGKSVAIVSYDEKPGIQAIATTAPDLPPEPGVHATFARDHEYKRHGTLSLLAGIDLLTGKVHALVRDRHRSREFIEFLKLLDAAYPARTAIKLILDNHSAHISKETRTWLAAQPAGRFEFTFTPKHGSWLNLIEGFFSKFARSVLRHIRVTSKHELKQRIMAGIDDVNRHPVIHTWSYKLAEAA